MTVFQPPNTETPSNTVERRTSPTLVRLTELRARGLGHEDIYLIMKGEGSVITKRDAYLFVIGNHNARSGGASRAGVG